MDSVNQSELYEAPGLCSGWMRDLDNFINGLFYTAGDKVRDATATLTMGALGGMSMASYAALKDGFAQRGESASTGILSGMSQGDVSPYMSQDIGFDQLGDLRPSFTPLKAGGRSYEIMA